MRIFLILSILFFLGIQTAKAESVWLVIAISSARKATLEKIEMKNMTQCEEQGLIFMESKIKGSISGGKEFVCLKGK